MSTATDRTTWYADSLQQLDQALYGPHQVQFPVQIELGGRQYSFAIWQGEQLPDQLLAYDTETTLIQGNEVPRLALAAVCGDQGSCYFVHPANLPRFVLLHQQAYWACHNAAFDFWTTAQALQSDPAAVLAWWGIAGGSRLYCTMLADTLIRLGRIDAEPIPRDLGTVAAEYCGLPINKDDPYRLRYGELLGLPAIAWQDTEPGYWQYAGCDPIATLQTAQAQFRIAQQLIEPHRTELLPDALQRFGPLTVCLQVQGAIALDYISKAGVQIDLQQASGLQNDISALVEQHQRQLEQLLPGCLRRHGPRSKQAGELQRTQAGVPKRNAKAIKAELERIAQTSSEPLRPAKLKNGSTTDAVKYWKQHRDLHPFIAAYVDYAEQAKLAQFFQQLDQPRIYPRYRPLVRTGRTSCSDPNLQQLPRDTRFREMITAAPGHWLLQIDYATLELRTLAQCCLRRYRYSRLAELFQQGTDPHRYTAALLLGLTVQQFDALPQAEQKQHRQRAKAVNFGVPGGLGADSLVAYAKHSYGVQLDHQQAVDFRKRLITQVYPELQTYLQDNQQQTIAGNLHTSTTLVRQVLPKREQIETAARIISGCQETAAGDPYQADLVHHIWLILQQLNRNPALAADLAAEQPSAELMRRCFYRTTATISGRLRGHVNFSQAANTPFQGLAADGNKLALFRLLRAGYRVCGFVHDEMLIELPDGTDYSQAVEQVQAILCAAMAELCPDVPIACEYLLADRWYKNAPQQPRDAAGRIVPYCADTPAAEQALQDIDALARPAIVQPQIEQAARQQSSAYDPQSVWSFSGGPADQGSLAAIEQPQLDQLPAPAEQVDTAKPAAEPKRTRRTKPAPARAAEQELVQPLKWHGGKHYLAKQIIELMPVHTHYVEPFAGGLSVLLAKDGADVSEVVNDLHGELTNFYRVLQDRQLFDQLYRRIEVVPLSQTEFQQALQSDPGQLDPVQAAVLFFIRMRQSRQGLGKDFATLSRNRTRRGMNEQVSAWLTAVAGLPAIHQRLQRVVICNQDALKLIKQQDGPQTLFYCDPPYLHSTRASTGEYACEMSAADHQQLLEVLAGVQGRFLLSGYPSDLYTAWADKHQYRCVQIEIDNKASSSKTKQRKIECLWMNY